MPRTQIFQLGEDISVVTDAVDERDFLDTFAEAVGELNNGTPLRPILSAGFDLIAKYRNLKSPVLERRLLAAGRWPHPSEEALAEAGESSDEDRAKTAETQDEAKATH